MKESDKKPSANLDKKSEQESSLEENTQKTDSVSSNKVDSAKNKKKQIKKKAKELDKAVKALKTKELRDGQSVDQKQNQDLVGGFAGANTIADADSGNDANVSDNTDSLAAVDSVESSAQIITESADQDTAGLSQAQAGEETELVLSHRVGLGSVVANTSSSNFYEKLHGELGNTPSVIGNNPLPPQAQGQSFNVYVAPESFHFSQGSIGQGGANFSNLGASIATGAGTTGGSTTGTGASTATGAGTTSGSGTGSGTSTATGAGTTSGSGAGTGASTATGAGTSSGVGNHAQTPDTVLSNTNQNAGVKENAPVDTVSGELQTNGVGVTFGVAEGHGQYGSLQVDAQSGYMS